jgi:histidine triad (HIT) family protein
MTDQDPECLFCKIVAGEIDSQKVYEDNDVFAFKDIHPQAPIHLLIIPRRHLPTLNSFGEEDAELAGKLMLAAKRLAAELELPGYRVAMNVERAGGQVVFHAHLHLLAGRRLDTALG